MFDYIEKLKFPVILLIIGSFLIFIGFYEINDLSKLQIKLHQNPTYHIILVGIFFCLISILLYIFDEITLGWIKVIKITNINFGISTKLNNTTINIKFGKLEKLSEQSEDSLVVLPANEFFNDECINDTKSALGAYIIHKFNNPQKIKKLIQEALNKLPYEEVEKETGIIQRSYKIGSSLLIKEPLGSKQPILFVAVTTKRAGEGIHSEISYIFKAINQVRLNMLDHRICSTYIPILGSGHGGLKKEVSLFAILLAICDTITKPGNNHIKEFNIVVYKKDEKSKSIISKPIAKRLLRIAIGMYK